MMNELLVLRLYRLATAEPDENEKDKRELLTWPRLCRLRWSVDSAQEALGNYAPN